MDRTNRSRSGAVVGPHSLLTPESGVVALIDYQPRMLFGVALGAALVSSAGLATPLLVTAGPVVLLRDQ